MIPSFKPGRAVRFRASEVAAALERHRAGEDGGEGGCSVSIGFLFALVSGIPGEALPEPDAEDRDVRATAFRERFSRERHQISEQVPDVPEREAAPVVLPVLLRRIGPLPGSRQFHEDAQRMQPADDRPVAEGVRSFLSAEGDADGAACEDGQGDILPRHSVSRPDHWLHFRGSGILRDHRECLRSAGEVSGLREALGKSDEFVSDAAAEGIDGRRHPADGGQQHERLRSGSEAFEQGAVVPEAPGRQEEEYRGDDAGGIVSGADSADRSLLGPVGMREPEGGAEGLSDRGPAGLEFGCVPRTDDNGRNGAVVANSGEVLLAFGHEVQVEAWSQRVEHRAGLAAGGGQEMAVGVPVSAKDILP